MIKDLTDLEIRQLLTDQHYGHLGCCEYAEKPYVVPVTYVYKDGKVYTYSRLGKKISIMEKQPKVCFQVEEVIDDHSWQSAIIWGTFRKLSGEEKDSAFTLLTEKFWEEFNRKISVYFPFRSPELMLNEKDMLMFAIDIEEMTGRYEQYI